MALSLCIQMYFICHTFFLYSSKALVTHYGDPHKVKEAYPHPLYVAPEFYNDIAIVELELGNND